MARFRKKPVEIEAVQWTGDNPEEIAIFTAEADSCVAYSDNDPRVIIETLEGTMTATAGDWIIKGVKGEFYPCKPDIFEATYERVE